MQNLTPADHALLRHLKREEEHYHNAYLRTDTKHPNIEQDLWRARKELKEFVAELRKQGKNI
jgi:hypothetical protein